VKGSDDLFPVHRIYCVGQNYRDHTLEMGGDPERELPFFFCKPADAVVADGAVLAYPLATENLHHEVELVVALKAGGVNIKAADAESLIFGYGVGNDLTRRDLQKIAKDGRRPWEAGKAFDHAAPVSALVPMADAELSADSKIELSVNGVLCQSGRIGDLIWSVCETISLLSSLFELQAGDLIFTGTPAGVGPLVGGDTAVGSIEGIGSITTNIAVRGTSV